MTLTLKIRSAVNQRAMTNPAAPVSPDFDYRPIVGQRLRQARLAAGLSQAGLAARLRRPVTKQALSKYETGKVLPSARVLMDLGHVLDRAPDWFLSEPRVQFRWLESPGRPPLPETVRETVLAFAEPRVEDELRLRRLFNLDLAVFPSVVAASGDDAERAAGELRRQWGLGSGPISNLAAAIEEQGAVVLPWGGDTRFTWLAGWADGEVPLIVANLTRPPVQARLDLAMAVGRLCLAAAPDGVVARFARALLVPREVTVHELGGRKDAPSLGELHLLGRRWGLGPREWLERACDLGLIDGATKSRLAVELRRRCHGGCEPAGYAGVEEPSLLRRIVWRAVIAGRLSERDAKETLPDFAEGLEELLPVPPPSRFRDLMHLSIEEREELFRDAESDPEEVALWDTLNDDPIIDG